MLGGGGGVGSCLKRLVPATSRTHSTRKRYQFSYVLPYFDATVGGGGGLTRKETSPCDNSHIQHT